MALTAKDIRDAMVPLARITKQRAHLLPEFRKGRVYPIAMDDTEDDVYAVSDDERWLSMCGVPCEPVNAAAVELWRWMGWSDRCTCGHGEGAHGPGGCLAAGDLGDDGWCDTCPCDSYAAVR